MKLEFIQYPMKTNVNDIQNYLPNFIQFSKISFVFNSFYKYMYD